MSSAIVLTAVTAVLVSALIKSRHRNRDAVSEREDYSGLV
jgi:hypothetical protein